MTRPPGNGTYGHNLGTSSTEGQYQSSMHVQKLEFLSNFWEAQHRLIRDPWLIGGFTACHKMKSEIWRENHTCTKRYATVDVIWRKIKLRTFDILYSLFGEFKLNLAKFVFAFFRCMSQLFHNWYSFFSDTLLNYIILYKCMVSFLSDL